MGKAFQELVTKELVQARKLHPPLNSAHESWAVIFEELDEFWEEVRKKRKKRSRAGMLKELVQVAAMAQRAAEDLYLMEGNHGS